MQSTKGCDFMHQIFDCTITDTTLNSLIERFVPHSDVYYFEDDQILRMLLRDGIPVYTHEEFSSSFPTFALEYGSLYKLWTLEIPTQSYVALVHASHLGKLCPEVRRKLLTQQIECGRGHVYDNDWFSEFEQPQTNTITVDGKWYYLLTSEDWWEFAPQTRARWVLRWLRERRKDDPTGSVKFVGDPDGVPYDLIEEYSGTFADKSGPNCFAAAIAMVVGGGATQNRQQSRVLISQWLHQEPFFRLLNEQGYVKFAECRLMSDLSLVQPSDVLVWYTSDGAAAARRPREDGSS